MKAETTQMIEDLLDAAGYGIGYWASTVSHDVEARTYTVTELEPEDEAKATQTVTYSQLRTAMVQLAAHDARLRPDLKASITSAIRNPEDADIDSEAADCIVQQALFGKVVYG